VQSLYERVFWAVRSADSAWALEALEQLPPGPERDGLRVHALVNLDRLDEADAASAAATAAHGRHRALVQPGAALKLHRETDADVRVLRLEALQAVSALPAQPHPAALTRDTGLIVCPREGAETVVINCGLSLGTPVIDRVLASGGYAAVHTRRYFQDAFAANPTGILDESDRLIGKVLDLAWSTGARRTIVCGASGLGIVAVVVGQRGGVAGVLTFCPPSTLNPEIMGYLGDRRRAGVVGPVNAGGLDELDLLAETRSGPSPVTVVYGDLPVDRAHARRLAEAPAVRAVHMGGVGHQTAVKAVAEGRLLDLLEDCTRA
jgi:hypothetical protein